MSVNDPIADVSTQPLQAQNDVRLSDRLRPNEAAWKHSTSLRLLRDFRFSRAVFDRLGRRFDAASMEAAAILLLVCWTLERPSLRDASARFVGCCSSQGSRPARQSVAGGRLPRLL